MYKNINKVIILDRSMFNAYNQLSTPVIIIDQNGKIVMINSEFSKVVNKKGTGYNYLKQFNINKFKHSKHSDYLCSIFENNSDTRAESLYIKKNKFQILWQDSPVLYEGKYCLLRSGFFQCEKNIFHEMVREIIETNDIFSFIISLNEKSGRPFNFLYASPQINNILGIEKEILAENPDNWISLIHPLDLLEYTSSNQKMIREKIPIKREYRMVHKNGEIKWILENIQPIYDSRGNLKYFSGWSRDNTEFRTNEKRLFDQKLDLKLTNDLLRASIKNFTFGQLSDLLIRNLDLLIPNCAAHYYLYDKNNGQVELINKSFKKNYSKKISSSIQIEIKDIVPKLDEGTFFRKALEQRKSIFITDEQQIIEVLKEHNTNPKIKSFNTWANSFQKIKTFVILPLVLDDVIFGLITATYKKVLSNYERERLIRFTKSTVAILDKAEKKRKLKEQKEFTEKILNTIPADIVIFDRNKRYAFINKFADLKNNRRECLLGKSIQDLVHEKELPKVKADSIDQNISLVQKSKQRVDWIDEVDTDKNTKKFILRSLYPLLENNEITQYLGFGVDITEQINSKKTIEKTLEESDKLQSMVLSSQMNPHFIFNCLNSLQYYILNNKEEDTLTYIALFSNLMRQSLENSDNFKISLEREIDFIKKYLDLQKSRYDGKIDYSISIDTSVNSSEVEIPPMFIQPYIENALFHGLAHKEDKGFVKIGLYINKSGFLLCKITDNGIGREKSKVLNEMNKKKQVSKGMRITEQRLEILRRIFDVNYSVEIIDKKNKKGQATGTEVILVIPQ